MSWISTLFHPSHSRLLKWLETGGPVGVGEHVDQCLTCADRLEHIDLLEDSVAKPDANPLRLALSQLVAPPDDLVDRVLSGVDGRLRAEREMSLITGLFAIGVETAQLLLDPGVQRDTSDAIEYTPDDDLRIIDDQEDNDRE